MQREDRIKVIQDLSKTYINAPMNRTFQRFAENIVSHSRDKFESEVILKHIGNFVGSLTVYSGQTEMAPIEV